MPILTLFSPRATSSSPQYILLDRAGLDSVKAEIGNGVRTFGVTARDSAFKKVREWVNPSFFDYRSQLKHQGLDSLSSAGEGSWVTTSGSNAWVPGPWGPTGPLTPAASGNVVYAAIGTDIRRSSNFLDATPNWSSLGSVMGSIYDFVLDPWDVTGFSHNGTNLAVIYLGSSTGVWKTVNATSALPTWTNVLTKAKFEADNPGIILDEVQQVRTTIAQQDLIYCLAIGHTGATYYVVICTTPNGGSTWYYSQVGVTTSYLDVHGIAVDQYNASIVLCACGLGKLYKSVDAGITFALSATLSSTAPLTNIEIPYANNAGGDTVIVSGVSSGSGYFALSVLGTGGVAPVSDTANILGVTDGLMAYFGPYSGGAATSWIEVSVPAGATKVRIHGCTIPVGSAHALNLSQVSEGAYEIALVDSPAPPADWHTLTIGGLPLFIGITCNHFGIDGHAYIDSVEFDAPFSNGFVLRSADGGITFAENITPSEGGATGFRGLQSDVLNSSHLTVLAMGTTLVDTQDGISWSVLSATVLSTAVAIGRWPYNATGLYFMDATHIYYSIDNGATLQDKTGDWAGFADPVNIIPVYTGPD
jgi:hypothetical protein